jgi:hypothetical protein
MTRKQKHADWIKNTIIPYEEAPKANPDSPQYYYWFFVKPPKDKLPKAGEVWVWSYTWPEGEVQERAYRIISTHGYGGKYPRAKYIDEIGLIGNLVFKELGGGGVWRKEVEHELPDAT